MFSTSDIEDPIDRIINVTRLYFSRYVEVAVINLYLSYRKPIQKNH